MARAVECKGCGEVADPLKHRCKGKVVTPVVEARVDGLAEQVVTRAENVLRSVSELLGDVERRVVEHREKVRSRVRASRERKRGDG